LEGVRLLLAVYRELSQERGRTRHFTKEQFTLMPQGSVAVDGGQPLLAVVTDVSEQVVAGDSNFRRETPNRFHSLRLPKFVFCHAKIRDVIRNDFDPLSRSSDGHQAHDKAASVFSPPRSLDRFYRSRAQAAFDQPVQIVR